MKLYQYVFRLLIVIGSVTGFFGGWAFLAHAGKPVAPQTQPAEMAPAPLPTLPPLNFSTNDAPSSLQPLPPPPSFSQNFVPRLRTRGS
jgi:hypothetical protein